MNRKLLPLLLSGLGILIGAMVPVAAQDARANKFVVLYNFKGGATDGEFPVGAPVFDSSGNIYGSTMVGGTNPKCIDTSGCGTIFQLAPQPGGGWKESILLDTLASDTNPAHGVIIDPAGNLYGTSGGSGPTMGGGPVGPTAAVFQASQSNGSWAISDLFEFNGSNQVYPNGLIRDASGNLYGTTTEGGTANGGYAFEVSPVQGGGWNTYVLYNFGSQAGDGTGAGPLVLDSKGNLYGAAGQGGAFNHGAIFELIPLGGGAWQEVVIHSFDGSDGDFPWGGLAIDAAGNLYGTTIDGGPQGFGVLFELSQQGDGTWMESILWNFGVSNRGGYVPFNANGFPVLDAAGNIYGTTAAGGTARCINCGVVYQLSRPTTPGGAWRFTVLHSFESNQIPIQLTLDNAGNIYGFTTAGGTLNAGTVYKLTP